MHARSKHDRHIDDRSACELNIRMVRPSKILPVTA
jgi:hypothetical protein